jgi:heptosyltransferase-3
VRRLVIRPGGIGDLIVSLPALESLKTAYFEVWTTRRNVTLLRFADRVRPIDATGLDLVGITRPALPAFRDFDEIVSWYGAARPEFRDAVSALPFRFFPSLPPEGAPVHATDFYLDQVRAFARPATDGIPRIACPAVSREYAVIHPFSGSPRKNWPLCQFRALAEKLARVMPVRWCAGDEDPPLPDAARFPDLYDLACWLAGARLYVGNDSGITHLAAAVGTPTLAIFVSSDPAVWAPRGPHVRVVTANMDVGAAGTAVTGVSDLPSKV